MKRESSIPNAIGGGGAHELLWKKVCIGIPGDVVLGPVHAASVVAVATPTTTSTNSEASSDSDTDDDDDSDGNNRVGLIFAAAERHVDPHNRLHKERPARITAIRDALIERKILQQCTVYETLNHVLTEEDYIRVHRPGYMTRLDKLSRCACSQRLEREAAQYQSIYLCQDSIAESKTAANSLWALTQQVLAGHVDHGFASIRPPGHHAEPSAMGGFCLLNNVAIAAAKAKAQGRKRIAIVDWDVHHGNGTEAIFLDDPDVLYFSVHRSNGFYPYTTGKPEQVGTMGRNVNVAWTVPGMGDAEYIRVWQQLLLPMLDEFQPDLIFIAAGFDAADGDMGECYVTPDGFGTLTRMLLLQQRGKAVCCPIVCALEGGYVRSLLGRCVSAVVEALLQPSHTDTGETLEEDDEASSIHPLAAQAIKRTRAAHQPYWKCLQDDPAS